MPCNFKVIVCVLVHEKNIFHFDIQPKIECLHQRDASVSAFKYSCFGEFTLCDMSAWLVLRFNSCKTNFFWFSKNTRCSRAQRKICSIFYRRSARVSQIEIGNVYVCVTTTCEWVRSVANKMKFSEAKTYTQARNTHAMNRLTLKAINYFRFESYLEISRVLYAALDSYCCCYCYCCCVCVMYEWISDGVKWTFYAQQHQLGTKTTINFRCDEMANKNADGEMATHTHNPDTQVKIRKKRKKKMKLIHKSTSAWVKNYCTFPALNNAVGYNVKCVTSYMML